MDRKEASATKVDRGDCISQKQFDLMLNYLKAGILPTMKDIRVAELERKGQIKIPSLHHFKLFAQKFRYRETDDSLVFKANSRIILPKNRFADAIKEAHRSKGHKHLNITKTVEMLSKKYTMGTRQYGISEEMVREVIHSCTEGSCLTSLGRSSSKKLKMKPGPKSSSFTTGTTINNSIPPQQFIPNLQSIAGQSYVAVPCLFSTPVSLHPGLIPLRPLLVVTEQHPNKYSNGRLQSTGASPATTDRSVNGSNCQVKITPNQQAQMPNLTQLSTETTTGPSGENCQQNHQGQPNTIYPQYIAITPLQNLPVQHVTLPNSCTSNKKNPSDPSGSTSLTNISKTVGAINLQQTALTATVNGNKNSKEVSKAKEEVSCPDEVIKFASAAENLIPITDPENETTNGKRSTPDSNIASCDILEQGKNIWNADQSMTYRDIAKTSSKRPKERSLGPVPYPRIWYHYKELNQKKKPMDRLVDGIKDMRPDILKLQAGLYSSADHLKRKIGYLEEIVHHLQQMSEEVGF